jgi:membrane protein DedA with SNARE-associated domain
VRDVLFKTVFWLERPPCLSQLIVRDLSYRFVTVAVAARISDALGMDDAVHDSLLFPRALVVSVFVPDLVLVLTLGRAIVVDMFVFAFVFVSAFVGSFVVDIFVLEWVLFDACEL